MPIYTYKGIDSIGNNIKGSITTESISQAKSRLSSKGVMLTQISEQKSSRQSKEQSLNFIQNISVEDLSLMTRQLATLVKAKIQIVEALGALMEQTENQRLRVILSEVRKKVNEGSSLHNALRDYSKVFNNVYTNMVEAGEQSGTLEIVLLRLADFTESQLKLKNRIKSAITYPIIMVVIGTIMFGVIFTVVIPKITKVFITMKKSIPLTTQICIWISEFFRNYWYLIILGIFFSYTSFMKYINTSKGKRWWHSLNLKLPIIGELITMINVSRFCSTLETLLNSGVPILTSMKIVKNLISNTHMQEVIEKARSNVQEGASIAAPLKKSQLFPPMVTHMISLGENSGELEPMLKIVAESYEDQVSNKLNGLTSILEPIMMVFMGAAVGFIVFSVVVPMMELNTIAK